MNIIEQKVEGEELHESDNFQMLLLWRVEMPESHHKEGIHLLLPFEGVSTNHLFLLSKNNKATLNQSCN